MANYDRDPTILCKTFVEETKEILSKYPEIQHIWSIDSDYEGCFLDIPKQGENGFDITIEIHDDEITLLLEGGHIHFEETNGVENTVQELLSLLRDLLSPTMRVVEYLSNKQSYKWQIESFRNGKWECENMTSLLFHNFFGKKTQKIYQNNILPSRIL